MHGGELVHGNIEEALQLALMKIERKDAVCTGNLQHVGDEARGDRHARLIFLVGAAVAVVRNDGGDAACRGALECVDHDQELHDGGAYRA